jgi:hypothetical protein
MRTTCIILILKFKIVKLKYSKTIILILLTEIFTRVISSNANSLKTIASFFNLGVNNQLNQTSVKQG